MDSWREENVRLEELIPVVRETLAQGRTVRLYPKGTSMLPMLRQGVDSVVLAPAGKTLRQYELPLYQRKNGQYVLHRVIRVGTNGYTCMGDNQFHPETGVEHSQVVAVVSAFYRGERRCEVDSWRYWLYCRFWCLSRPLRRVLRAVEARLRRQNP